MPYDAETVWSCNWKVRIGQEQDLGWCGVWQTYFAHQYMFLTRQLSAKSKWTTKS